MRVLLVVGIASLVAACPVSAAQQFMCGGARVEVAVSIRGERSLAAEDGRSTVVVLRDGRKLELAYVENDFIGGHCLKAADGHPMVVFQAYCGGSGCQDLDNWGIVDPRTLQVLLEPNGSNRGDAQSILGVAPVRPAKMLNVEQEVNRVRKNAP